AIAFVAWRAHRDERTRAPLIGIALLPLIVMLSDGPPSFAARYPGTLHFFAAPLHAIATAHPLNVERMLNALAIPVWLLILRPLILRRHATAGTFAVAALLFWQKDVVYYFTSGYLEPWAIVIVLTALEHVITYNGADIHVPLLLLGTAAIMKEHVVITLPIVALAYRAPRAALLAITPC